MATAKKWKRRTFNGSNMSRALNLTDKRRIEQTVWWNNYRMYNQWQQNALAWTWHVAWIPTQQAPQMTLNAPMSTAWNTETTTPANNTQGTTTPVTAAPRVTSSRPRTTSAQPWNSGPQMRNANLNLWAYGDDSSRENYDDPSEWWGQNPKYEWEWVKNTFIGYDPNATIEGLDPNYKFWWDAQLANSADANYIARRNDQIASALYNAWVRDSVQVADFLNSMEWFQNSNSNECIIRGFFKFSESSICLLNISICVLIGIDIIESTPHSPIANTCSLLLANVSIALIAASGSFLSISQGCKPKE